MIRRYNYISEYYKKVFGERTLKICIDDISPFVIIEIVSLIWLINNGIISDITFLPLKNDSAPRKLFLRGIFRSDIEFDKIRDCEIENMVLRWNDENNLIKNSEMYFYVNKCFSKYFEIKEIKYDISKIIFYRIKMLASKIGNVKINRVFNLNIEILPENSETSNECINIGCVNTYTRNKKIQIRKGTLLILYITDVRN